MPILPHTKWIALALVGGCVADLGDDTDAPIETDPVEVVGPWTTQIAETVVIQRNDPWFPSMAIGFLVRDNLAIGPDLTSPTTDTWRWTPGSSAPWEPIAFINRTPNAPGLAVYQLRTNSVGATDRVDTRSAAALAAHTVQCWSNASGGGGPRSALLTITGGTAAELTASSVVATEYVTAWDVGAPCTTTTTPHLVVGFVRTADTTNRTAVLTKASALRGWIDGMVNLGNVRADSRTRGPFRLSTDPAIASAPRLCIDVPNAAPSSAVPLQQYPCHTGANQIFYIDYRADQTYPQLVIASSGRCVDVANGDANPGEYIQQYDCHGGANQKFTLAVAANAVTTIKPRSGVATDQCVAVRGGPTTSPAAIEQRTCTNNPLTLQQWWRLDPAQVPR